jgi:hypothetical protein
MTTAIYLNGATLMTTPTQRVLPIPHVPAIANETVDSGPWSLETFNPSYWKEDPGAVADAGLAAVTRILS